MLSSVLEQSHTLYFTNKLISMFAQRSITLVLMMINSCSYNLLMILCLFSFSYLS